MIEAGRKAKTNGTASIIEPKPDDIYMFSYTSGTTGDPKGVKLSHKMLINMAYGAQTRCEQYAVNENDCYISYLPAAHSFEQGVFALSLIYGMKCGFFGGNVAKITEDIAILKPTLFTSVPRLYNRIYSKV